MNKGFAYSVYGLKIVTNEPVFGLLCAATDTLPDIRVEFGHIPEYIFASLSNGEVICQSPALTCAVINGAPGYFYVRYCDGSEFVIHADGSRVWCTWPDSLTFEDSCVYLLGPIFGLAQQLMGRTILHASAVVISGTAVALLGAPGAGKSTTAAMLAQMGHSVLSEDALPLIRNTVDGSIMAQPGYGLVRLWPDSAKILYGSETALPKLTPTWEKLYLDLSGDAGRLQPTAEPLSTIYILAQRSSDQRAPYIEPVSPAEALLALVANPYPGLLYLEQRRAADFAFLGETLKKVKTRRITPHSDPRRLGAMCELITQDVVAGYKSSASLPYV